MREGPRSGSWLAGLPSLLAFASLLTLGALASPAPGAERSYAVPSSLPAAESLATEPSSRRRDEALGRWARRASLEDLVFLLRRPAAELAGGEAAMLNAALASAPENRADLRARLWSRLARSGSASDRARALREMARTGALPRAQPAASVFRWGILLPDSGDYDAESQAIRIGIEAGVARFPSLGGRAIDLEIVPTGHDDPGRAVAGFDAVTERAGVVIGELLGRPTLAVAAAARMRSVPLISPAASDEDIGRMGPAIFQIGPSREQSGAALARQALVQRPRWGWLASTTLADGPFLRGFLRVADSLGVLPVWNATYSPGSQDHRGAIRAARGQGVALLVWDGEAREAEPLLRQLAQERGGVRVAGGAELNPGLYHPNAVALLENAWIVSEEWTLPASDHAWLDSTLKVQGVDTVQPHHARGFRAARVLAAAVSSGALAPEEITAFLDQWRDAGAAGGEQGFLLGFEGASLPVGVVRRGRVEPFP